MAESKEFHEAFSTLFEKTLANSDGTLIGVCVQVVRLEGDSVKVSTGKLLRACADDDQSESHAMRHEVLLAEDCIKALEDNRLESMEKYVALVRAERTPTTEGH